MTDQTSTTSAAPRSEGRVLLDKQDTQAYEALLSTSRAVRESAAAAGLERRLMELVNLRVSQINGCAFCLDVHTRAALKDGESTRRLSVLSAWRTTELFTPEEQAALSLAEAATRLEGADSEEAAYAFAQQHLSPEQVSAVAWAAITMNAFNRLSILSRHPVRPRRQDEKGRRSDREGVPDAR
jgi:AhpD family alkylhydroperoxidase